MAKYGLGCEAQAFHGIPPLRRAVEHLPNLQMMELPECWNCRKKGHISAVCWAPGGGMDPARRMKKRKVDSPEGKAKAYVVEEEAEEFVEESDDEEEEDD